VTRIYVPTTLDDLRAAHLAGRITPGPDAVVLRSEVGPAGATESSGAPEASEEQEYAALMTAADISAALLDGPGRRVVLVAELPAGADTDHPVPWKRVVAVHADPADRPVGADPDEDLGWYATQEIPDLL